MSGLNQPTDFRFLPDGRILIAEKGGAIKVYHDGHVHDEPLITLAVLQTDNDEERGLLGIEVDPDFEHNGYLYVSYTTAQNHDRLSRITVAGDTPTPHPRSYSWSPTSWATCSIMAARSSSAPTASSTGPWG